MAIQIGRKKQVPIYGTTTTTGPVLSTDTLSNYFTITQGSSYGWTYNVYSGTDIGLIEMAPGNIGVNSTTAIITFEAVRDLPDVRIDYRYYTESNFDKITVSIDDEILLNSVSGVVGPSDPTASGTTLENLIMNRTIYQGEKITFKYVKDPSQSHTYESYTKFLIQCTPYTETTTEITGYEEKLLPQTISSLYLSPTKKIIGGWIKDSSGAKLFYGGLAFGYTGNYTTSTITISGTNYDLYTLTSAGTLTLPKAAQVWACGGGSGGHNAGTASTYGYSGTGGHGGYVLETITLSKGKYVVTIGAGGQSNSSGGNTVIGNYSAKGGNIPNKQGGSGGGRSYSKSASDGSNSSYQVGTGARISTYPFGLTSLKAHCAGGGAGATYGGTAGDGGSNGSNGLTTNSGSHPIGYPGGVGGEYGGGEGGVGYTTSSYTTGGSNATFYGAGGGGGGLGGAGTNITFITKAGGKGYQGVVYVAIPK